jgi:hypothetical protein
VRSNRTPSAILLLNTLVITFQQFAGILKLIKPEDRISLSFNPALKLKEKKNQLVAHFKPVGLWYAVGPKWLQWINTSGEASYWLERYSCVYKIDLNYDRVLQLSTYKDIHKFTEQYGTEIGPGGFYKLGINWKAGAYAYSGVEIWPYNQHAHNKFDWYKSWSIGSGCIWKNDAIAKLTKLEF